MAAIAPEILYQLGPLPITNTLINTLMIDGLLVGGAIYLSKNIKKIPGAFQNGVEALVEIFYDFTESITGKNAGAIFPWIFTFFIFILISNWSGLLPGFASIGWFEEVHHEAVAEDTTHETDSKKTVETHEEKRIAAESDDHAIPADEHAATSPTEEKNAVSAITESKTNKSEEHAKPETHIVPLFRNATSDANTTFAFAIISVVATHVLSVRKLGWKEYLGKFFSLNPIFLFVGLLEIISEITKMVSLSFRLFGNIYAGEVVLATVNSLFAFVFPLPFMALEIIVGLVQALVFAILTMVFMSIMMTPHHAENEAKH